MRIPRIYHPDLLAVDQQISLSKDAAHHLANVLRVKAGTPVVLFNGDGNEYSGELVDISKREVIAQIDAKLTISPESPLALHLGQAVSKGDRMELVLQKSVELGVSDITPLLTERCNVKLTAERWEKKRVSWLKILHGACEQSGRNVVPTLHMPVSLNDWLQQSTSQLRLTLDPTSSKRMAELSVPQSGIRLLIGPEGGLSEQEVYQAQEHGYSSVKLGPRILRTETAALAALSILQSHYGDL